MFVSSRGYKISYQVFGGGQVVVLLHGHPMWGGRWVDRGYVAGLQDRFREAQALPCRFEQVPGEYVVAFAQAANVLPMAIAHFNAAARSSVR